MEDVFLVKDGKKYQGYVLGSEQEYFWLLVTELNEVYLGHPDRVFESSGTKCFAHYDRRNKVDEMFDGRGVFSSDLFSYSDKPDKMIGLLMAHKLICIV